MLLLALGLSTGRPAQAHGDHSDQARRLVHRRLEQIQKDYESDKRERDKKIATSRQALRERLGRHLKNRPLTEPIKAELKTHATRVAAIDRIRYVAAREDDFERMFACDRLLTAENYRHEQWWQAQGEHKPPAGDTQ